MKTGDDKEQMERFLNVCDRLKSNPDFEYFHNYLRDRLNFLREQSDEIDNDRVLHVNQGARAEIKRLLKFITTPEEILFHIREQKALTRAQKMIGGI